MSPLVALSPLVAPVSPVPFCFARFTGAPYATEGSSYTIDFSATSTGGSTALTGYSISWGDGTSSGGTISANGGGTYSVSGSHTFASAGSYYGSVNVSDSFDGVGQVRY